MVGFSLSSPNRHFKKPKKITLASGRKDEIKSPQLIALFIKPAVKKERLKIKPYFPW